METMTDPLKMSKYEMKDEDALSLAKVDLGFSRQSSQTNGGGIE